MVVSSGANSFQNKPALTVLIVSIIANTHSRENKWFPVMSQVTDLFSSSVTWLIQRGTTRDMKDENSREKDAFPTVHYGSLKIESTS